MLVVSCRGFALGLMALALATPAMAAPSFQSGETVGVSGAYEDMAFAAGGRIHVDATSSDRLFAAGGEIDFAGGDIKSLVVSGGDLRFEGARFGDVTAVGGQLRFESGAVANGVVLAGGDIDTAQGFEIGGSAVIAGGKVRLAGHIGDSATVRGGEIEIAGAINGDADLVAERIIIGPNARIGGDLTYRARKIDISSDAVITGKTTALPYEPAFSKSEIFGLMIGGLVIAALIYFVGTAILALALTGLAPGLMASTAARIRAHPLATLGAGLLWAIAVPVLAAILCATIIGLPLGFVLVGLYILAFPFGGTAAVHFVGMTLRGWLGGKDEPRLGGRLAWTLLGALVLCVLVLIPFVGGVIWTVAGIMGLGALVAELMHAWRREPEHFATG